MDIFINCLTTILYQVNRSLRTPLSSQLIFMPSGTATAAVATVTQQQTQQHQQHEVTPVSSNSQSDTDQVRALPKNPRDSVPDESLSLFSDL